AGPHPSTPRTRRTIINATVRTPHHRACPTCISTGRPVTLTWHPTRLAHARRHDPQPRPCRRVPDQCALRQGTYRDHPPPPDQHSRSIGPPRPTDHPAPTRPLALAGALASPSTTPSAMTLPTPPVQARHPHGASR